MYVATKEKLQTAIPGAFPCGIVSVLKRPGYVDKHCLLTPCADTVSCDQAERLLRFRLRARAKVLAEQNGNALLLLDNSGIGALGGKLLHLIRCDGEEMG